MYQLHLIERNKTFALPVYGDKRTIWDALAKHLHFRTYRTLCEVQGIDAAKHKKRFKLVEVQS